jgi:hypothetical protein
MGEICPNKDFVDIGGDCMASFIMVVMASRFMTRFYLTPNTALEPTAAAPSFYGFRQIHACSYSRRGSALDR